MDISFKTENSGRFNYRVCAMMLSGETILAMRDENAPYFYLPGGRVELGETAEQAVLRELREELDIRAKVIRPLWLCQNFFTEDVNGLRYHELCIYFLVDISGTDLLSRGLSFTRTEGKHTLSFEWLDFTRLKDEYFYPEFLKEDIFHLPDHFTLRADVE